MKTRLSVKFYITALVLLLAIALGWHVVGMIMSGGVKVDDGKPMDGSTKILLSTLISAVLLSWCLSLFTMIRQMFVGSAFSIDSEGIRLTATAKIVFAFIFVVPIKLIPYAAIRSIREENGVLTAEIDKSKIRVLPLFKPLVSKEYHFFAGYTKTGKQKIRAALDEFMGEQA